MVRRYIRLCRAFLWYSVTTVIGASSNHHRARAEETPGGGRQGRQGMAAYCPWKRVIGCDCRSGYFMGYSRHNDIDNAYHEYGYSMFQAESPMKS